jgi:predicted transglutaminase-like cysteine proteinase
MKGLILIALLSSMFTISPYSSANIPNIQDNHCSDNQVIDNWNHMIEEAQYYDDEMKVLVVNSFFNTNIRYKKDTSNWEESNFWATPFESMINGQGDCEDYAIAKFKSLLLLGIPEDNLSIHHVNIKYGRSNLTDSHMVLVYKNEEGESFVLDNIDARILPIQERYDLTTVFSFNIHNLWIGESITQYSPIDKISQWRNLLTRFNYQSPFCIS